MIRSRSQFLDSVVLPGDQNETLEQSGLAFRHFLDLRAMVRRQPRILGPIGQEAFDHLTRNIERIVVFPINEHQRLLAMPQQPLGSTVDFML